MNQDNVAWEKLQIIFGIMTRNSETWQNIFDKFKTVNLEKL